MSIANVKAEDLQPGMVIDLEPLWTAEYDYALHAFAESELAVVESVERSNDNVLIYLESAPSNAVAPVDFEFPVHEINKGE